MISDNTYESSIIEILSSVISPIFLKKSHAILMLMFHKYLKIIWNTNNIEGTVGKTQRHRLIAFKVKILYLTEKYKIGTNKIVTTIFSFKTNEKT